MDSSGSGKNVFRRPTVRCLRFERGVQPQQSKLYAMFIEPNNYSIITLLPFWETLKATQPGTLRTVILRLLILLSPEALHPPNAAHDRLGKLRQERSEKYIQI